MRRLLIGESIGPRGVNEMHCVMARLLHMWDMCAYVVLNRTAAHIYLPFLACPLQDNHTCPHSLPTFPYKKTVPKHISLHVFLLLFGNRKHFECYRLVIRLKNQALTTAYIA